MTVFWGTFVVTLLLLLGAVWTGVKRRRRRHFVVAPLALAGLAITVVLTEELMRGYQFPEREMGIHLPFAWGAAVLVLPVVLTGLLTVRRPRWRRVHLACVGLFFVVALAAIATGVWMFSVATPR